MLASCTAETEPATEVGVSSAKVWAKVSFDRGESGVYWFERSSNGGTSWVRAPSHRWGPAGQRATNTRVPETLTGLAAGTTYRYRICGYVTHTNPDSSTQCMDADGKAGGGHDSFTTARSACSATLSPGGQSLQSFLDARSNGQVACLTAGTYAPNARVDVTRDITLRAAPGARVTIKGELNITANGVTVEDIFMRGTEDVRVIDVKASLVTLNHLDVTYDATYDREGQGIMVGGSGRRVSGVRILSTRIHNVGSRDNDAYDHAVYCENADGLRAEGNWLHDNEGGYGFHLYPDCDNAVIRFNVSHSNDHGDVIAGNDDSSSGNLFEANSYSDNTGWYRPARRGVGCSEPGGGNVVRNVNVWPAGSSDCPFGFSGTTYHQPQYRNAGFKDFRIDGPPALRQRFGLWVLAVPGPRG